MFLSFAHPLWLLALPPLLYLLFIIQRRSYIPARRSRHLFWFGIRCILLGLIVFALAGLQFKTLIRKNQTLFLVDLSDSIAPEQKEKAIRFLNDALRDIHSPDQAGVIAFGSQAEVERFPATPQPVPRFESQIDTTSTNLENALRLADGVMAEDYQKNVVILTDGLENAGDAAKLVKSLKQKGVSFQGHYLQPADVVEAQVESVRVPSDIRLREAFNLEVITQSNRQMPGILQVFRNGDLLEEGTVQLRETGKHLIRIPQTITEPGLYRFDVRIKPEQDYQAENNVSQAWVAVKGPPRILLVDANPRELQILAEAFERRGFIVDLKEGRYFPRTLPDLVLYQAILMRNVPATTIHSQMPLIQQYVHEFGGGFAMLGGKTSFGPGGYYQTPVETVLPVRMDLINKKYLADVAMVIVIDKSGSMSYADRGRQKIDLADEGGARVASLLKQTDHLGVLAVDSVAKWAYPVQRLSNKADAIDAIISVRAGGGGIYVYSGLREAYQALQNIKASVKHVILFADTADCEEKEGPSGESSLLLASRALEQHQITTTTIGIGQTGDRDVGFLEQLAVIASGRFYFTNDMFTLPQIFAQESAVVQRNYITEETFLPKMNQVEPLLSGLTGIPELDGYVATTGKNFATISLLSDRDDPILAFWRHGLGQSLAYTSDPVGPWGAKWLAWSDWERFWTQTARYLAHESEPAEFQVSVNSGNEQTTVVVDTFDETNMEQESWSGALVDSDGKEHTLKFSRTSPGRVEARIPASSSLFGKVFRLKENQIQQEAIVQFAAPVNQEYEISNEGMERLQQMTGPLVESAQQLRFESKTATDVQPVRPQLLFWAIFLFLMDVAVRKLDPGMFRVRRRMETSPATVAVPMQRLKIRKLEIEKQRPVIVEIDPFEAEPQVELQQPAPQSESDYMNRLKEAKKKSKDHQQG